MPHIVFLTPLMLIALTLLPVLWFLLRVTPPPAKRIIFPATRFLKGLVSTQQTPSKTPWWILLLRMLALALIIIALARPVLNPSDDLPGGQHLRLVIDNSWAAARNWDAIKIKTDEIIRQANKDRKVLYILPTSAPPGQNMPEQYGPLSYTQAHGIIKGLALRPWPAHYNKLAEKLKKETIDETIYTLWLGHGIDEENTAQELSQVLQNQGGLSYYTPEAEALPLLLSTDELDKNTIIVRSAGQHKHNLPLTLHTLTETGSLLDQKDFILPAHERMFSFSLKTIDPKTTILRLAHKNSAGSTYLLNRHTAKKTVGIVAPEEENDGTAFVDAHYYLKRALEPYATLKQGRIDTLIKEDISLLILPDTGSLPLDTLNHLNDWVTKKGGVLLRFAGPKMAEKLAQEPAFLTPVPLRIEERVLNGALTWDTPSGLAPFSKNSPFYDLPLPDDIEIKQQILARPTETLEQKTWIALEDGTPLVTADAKGKGFLILVHTSATPTWSNLPLSGLYVSMLERIVDLSNAPDKIENTTNELLSPLTTLNGTGQLEPPASYIQSFAANDKNKVRISSTHPPGFYGRGAYHFALNLGDQIKYLSHFEPPVSVEQRFYDNTKEQELAPPLLVLALLLFMLDWIIMMLIASNRRLFFLPALCLMIICLTSPAYAQGENDNPVLYAAKTHLAYIKTGDSALDKTAYNGLTNLSVAIGKRTSIDMGDVVGLNPETDSLDFFPLIYWPISKNQPPLSAQAAIALRSYMNHGGMLFFDTRDQQNKALNGEHSFFAETSHARILRELTIPLDIAPLTPIPEGHVLSRSFYLLKDSYPGYYKGGTLWIEENSSMTMDGVSSVIIGGHDWAKAWAIGENGTRDQEMVFRFGINLVIHTLTGNYKEDQIHIPHILERLGQ